MKVYVFSLRDSLTWRNVWRYTTEEATVRITNKIIMKFRLKAASPAYFFKPFKGIANISRYRVE